MRTLCAHILSLVAIATTHTGHAHDVTGEARYLANEGVLVTQGDAKVLFDPFFHEGFGHYRLVPDEMREAMFAGEPPYDGVDAIFVSHAHTDHFSARDVARYMTDHPNVILIAPRQAVVMLLAEFNEPEEALLRRIAAIGLDYEASPAEIEHTAFKATAVRIPHAGGPSRREVENMAYRVTLGDGPTVMHLGDADPNDRFYAPHEDHWQALRTDMAFPPYWFFLSPGGDALISERLNAADAVGVHVPKARPGELKRSGADFFSTPGEVREVGHGHE